MRSHGEISGIRYKLVGFDIYHLAYEYTLTNWGEWTKTIYVDDMSGIRAAITHYLGEDSHATG